MNDYKLKETDKNIIDAIVGLFVILPNPQCKGLENKIRKVAYDLAEKEMNKKLKYDSTSL